MEQQEFFGYGAINNLADILERENSSRIFLVTGKSSFEKCSAKQTLRDILKDYKVRQFNEFSSNPKLEETSRGFEIFEKENADIIVAVGGGSVIDVAKSIKLFYYEKGEKRKIPLVAIPTTAGSGSEATYFVVYYVGKEKQSKGNPEITLPDYSICDPKLTLSLPKYVAASTGIDALGQAIESFWSINSTEKSKEFSKEAINILIGNLERVVNNPTRQNKEQVMRAANFAGKAINIAKTTASHAVSYPITSYFGISHGHAVGLTLGEMVVYNSQITKKDCLDNRGIEYVNRTIQELCEILKVKTPEKAGEIIERLMKKISLEIRLSGLGLNERDLNIIIENGFTPERVGNNPRILTKENLLEILKKIY